MAQGALVAVAPEMDAIPMVRNAARSVGGFWGNRGAIALEQKVGLAQQMQRPRDRQGDAPPPPPQAIWDAQDVRSPSWQPNQGANNMSALVPVPDPNHMMPRGAPSEGTMVARNPIAHFVPQDRPGFALAHEQLQDEIRRSQALFQAQQESLMREEREQAQRLANAQMVASHLQNIGPPQEGFMQAFARLTGIRGTSSARSNTAPFFQFTQDGVVQTASRTPPPQAAQSEGRARDTRTLRRPPGQPLAIANFAASDFEQQELVDQQQVIGNSTASGMRGVVASISDALGMGSRRDGAGPPRMAGTKKRLSSRRARPIASPHQPEFTSENQTLRGKQPM